MSWGNCKLMIAILFAKVGILCTSDIGLFSYCIGCFLANKARTRLLASSQREYSVDTLYQIKMDINTNFHVRLNHVYRQLGLLIRELPSQVNSLGLSKARHCREQIVYFHR